MCEFSHFVAYCVFIQLVYFGRFMRFRVLPLRRKGRRLPWRQVQNGPSYSDELITHIREVKGEFLAAHFDLRQSRFGLLQHSNDMFFAKPLGLFIGASTAEKP